MIPVLSNFILRPLVVATDVSGLNYFPAQEATLPPSTRILLKVHMDPSEDIETVAEDIQAYCDGNYLSPWPEFSSTNTLVEEDTLYIMYLKPAGQVTPSIGIIAIIGIILLIAPIIMYFAIPGVQQLVNGIISIVILVLMMKIMMPMLSSITEEKPKVTSAQPAQVSAPKEPFEQRVSKRVESIAESIERTERAFERSKSAGIAGISGVVNDITRLVSAIRGAPSTSMSDYQKGKAAREIDALDDRLDKYISSLTPEQLARFQEEQRIVNELRAMYD